MDNASQRKTKGNHLLGTDNVMTFKITLCHRKMHVLNRKMDKEKLTTRAAKRKSDKPAVK